MITFAQKKEKFDLEHFWKDYSISQKKKYAQKNAHFWEQKFLLFLLIEKYIQVHRTYKKVSFLYSKEPLWNKIFRQKSAQIRRVKTCIKFSQEHQILKLSALYLKCSGNFKKQPVFRIKFKELNLELFRKNYSNYNRICMFPTYIIPKLIFDIFQLFFKKVHLKTLNKLNQKLYFNR